MITIFRNVKRVNSKKGRIKMKGGFQENAYKEKG